MIPFIIIYTVMIACEALLALVSLSVWASSFIRRYRNQWFNFLPYSADFCFEIGRFDNLFKKYLFCFVEEFRELIVHSVFQIVRFEKNNFIYLNIHFQLSICLFDDDAVRLQIRWSQWFFKFNFFIPFFLSKNYLARKKHRKFVFSGFLTR